MDPRVDRALLALDASVSVLWQPVFVDGRVEALLNVSWRHRVAESARAVRSVRAIADEVGAVLHTTRLREELERFAATDPLTGSLNRRAWDLQLQAMVDGVAGTSAPHVIAVIDLDNFKAYNDANGHSAGDDFLRGFADASRAGLRAGDAFARWGGEEFIVALPNTTLDQADRVLERIRASVPSGQTCSIGYTAWDGAEPRRTPSPAQTKPCTKRRAVGATRWCGP